MKKLRKYLILCTMVLCLLGSALVAHAETIEVPHEEDYMDNVYATPAASTIAHLYSVQTGEEDSGYPKTTSILPFIIQQYQGHLNFFTLRMDKFVQTDNGKFPVDKYRHGYAFWVVSDAPFKVGVENLSTAPYDSKNSMYAYLLTSGGGAFSDNNKYECTLPNQVVYSNDLSYSNSGLQAQRDFIADLVDFSRDIVENEEDVPQMNGIYDNTMPGVKNLSLKTLSAKDCHGSIDNYNMCLGLRWSSPDNAIAGDRYAVYVDLSYNYGTYWSTKRSYGSAKMLDVSNFGGNAILIDSLAVDLCAHDFAENVSVTLANSMDHVTSFTVENVTKIYIQSVREVDGQLYHGDWYVYKVNKDGSLSADYNKQELGDGDIISGDIDPDDSGDFPDDADKKGSIPAPEKDSSAGFGGLDFSDLSGVFSTFSRILENLMGALGSFPALLATVFQFLPYELYSAIIFLFYLAVIVGLIRIFT